MISLRDRGVNLKTYLQKAHIHKMNETIQSTNASIFLGSGSETPLGLSHDSSAHNCESIPLGLQLGDLIGFLPELVGLDKTLQMSCPLSSHLLLFLYFGFQHFGYTKVKVEFSQLLATTFIRYVMECK